MPRIENTPVHLFGPEDPYHWAFDNLPLKNLMRRQNLINMALDDLIEINRNAIGTQGSVANRLNQSLDEDGTLKAEAVDETLHSIESHTDSDTYVRMLKAESDKLALIADEATNLMVEVPVGDDTTYVFEEGIIKFEDSSSVTWDLTDSNKLKAHLAFPAESAHRHFYDQVPVLVEEEIVIGGDNYDAYFKVNSEATPFIDGSLRIYINGVRLTANNSVYVPGYLVTDAWTLMTFASDAENGIFALSAAIAESDIVTIDYDISYL